MNRGTLCRSAGILLSFISVLMLILAYGYIGVSVVGNDVEYSSPGHPLTIDIYTTGGSFEICVLPLGNYTLTVLVDGRNVGNHSFQSFSYPQTINLTIISENSSIFDLTVRETGVSYEMITIYSILTILGGLLLVAPYLKDRW